MAGSNAEHWKRRSVVSIASAVLMLVVAPAPVLADEQSDARVLFDEGRRLLAEGKIEEACRKLELSFHLDPGAGTKFNLALCYERASRFASAWAAYNDVATMTQARGETGRAEVARNRATVLAPRLSWITIVVPDASRRVDGLEIQRDGRRVPSAEWGTNLPVDIGAHIVQASTPEHAAWSMTMQVEREGQVIEVRVPVLERSSSSSAPPPQRTTPSAVSDHDADARDRAAAGDTHVVSWWKLAGQGLVGLGVVTVGVGAFFGARSLSRWSDSDSQCTGNVCRDPGYDLRRDSIRDGDIATGVITTGIVLASVGTVLWLTSPRPNNK